MWVHSVGDESVQTCSKPGIALRDDRRRRADMVRGSLAKFARDDDGATAAEYAVLLGLIILALISSITAVGQSTSGLWTSNTKQISSATHGS